MVLVCLSDTCRFVLAWQQAGTCAAASAAVARGCELVASTGFTVTDLQ